MKFDKLTRRHFLQGLGGFALSLPLLPSLWPRSSQAGGTSGPKCLAFIENPHGGITYENWFGPMLGDPFNFSPGISSVPLFDGGTDFPAHAIRHGDLASFLTLVNDSSDADNGQSRLSYINGSFLNPLMNKLNLIRGIDYPYYCGHHRAYLGNFQQAINNDSAAAEIPPIPTIDYVLGQSPSFYPSLASVTTKTMNLGEFSFGPLGVKQPITTTSGSRRSRHFFDYVFNGGQSANLEANTYILDKVHEDYARLTKGANPIASRLGSEDRQRLEATSEMIFELEQSLQATANCGEPTPPESNASSSNVPESAQVYWEHISSTIALAFNCGASRIATIAGGHPTNFTGDYHQDIAHQHISAEPQAIHAASNRFVVEHLFARLALKLEAIPGIVPGTTLLDDSLVVVQSEAGHMTHHQMSSLTLTAGSAGGALNTGKYVDYRSLDNMAFARPTSMNPSKDYRPGLLQNQFLGTILQAMGLNRGEYEDSEIYGIGGYGHLYYDTSWSNRNGHVGFPTANLSQAGDPLPILWAG